MRQSTAWLMTHEDAVVDEDGMRGFASLVARRAGGEPAAYLLGYREFFGRDFAVTPAVLIPRPETELLVGIALETLASAALRRAGSAAEAEADAEVGPRILDLGTGSGCIAISLALEVPRALVSAVDFSEAALAVARGNAQRHGARVDFRQGDWYAAVGSERFDLIVANPPYIASADPHLGAADLRHEPITALASGADGLDAIRRIIGEARHCLAPGGQLWLEHGYDQAESVRQLLTLANFADIAQYRDLAGIVRVSGGRA